MFFLHKNVRFMVRDCMRYKVTYWKNISRHQNINQISHSNITRASLFSRASGPGRRERRTDGWAPRRAGLRARARRGDGGEGEGIWSHDVSGSSRFPMIDRGWLRELLCGATV